MKYLAFGDPARDTIVFLHGGNVAGWQLLVALALIPFLAIGLALSRPLAHRLAGRSLRTVILYFAAAAGAAALIRALAG